MVSKIDFELSELEAEMFRVMSDALENKGHRFLSVNSLVTAETLLRQGVVNPEYIQELPGTGRALAGSAEQGILEYFTDQRVDDLVKIYAYNQCFRVEDQHLPYYRLSEFRKMEQYVFTTEPNWLMEFEDALENVTRFLGYYDIEYRVVDCTQRDEGYHRHKVDVEINTPLYGWVESHSLTYFGEEQARRFNICRHNGELAHTISATAIASPRILLPFIMEGNQFNRWK